MVKIGQKYKHYKGNIYIVLNIARHTETDNLEELVIYQDISSPEKIWARPKTMFEGNITIDSKKTKRFTEID